MWSSCAWVRTSASTSVEPAVEVAEVGQDQVHAGLVGVRKQDSTVDNEKAAEVLEDRHVPADLAKAAQGDDAQAAGSQRGRRGQIRVRVAHALRPSPAASRRPR